MGAARGDFWNGRPVLVTGATGLLGGHLVAQLLERGAAVVCLRRDRPAAGQPARAGLDARVTVVRGELEDAALLERAIDAHQVDTVFHLAAQAIVGTASASPLSTWESNVRGTYLLLEACRRSRARVERVVVASSDKAYGDQAVLPYVEEAPLVGRFPYDCSKACADLIAQSYHRSFDLPVCITRCGNLFGPGDLNWNRIVPGTVRSALRGEPPLIRSDGEYVRDYFYVEDAAVATLELAEQMPRAGVTGEPFNFSEERPLTVLDMCRRTLAAAGRADLEPRIQNQASNEIREQYLSCAKARRLLGWRPRHGLDEGLRRTVAWYRELLEA